MQASALFPLALNAPRIPAAVGNGGLRWLDLSDPNAALQVQIVLSPGEVGLNDRVDLYWEGTFVATTNVNQDHLAFGVITLSVLPADILQFADGDHQLYYNVTSAIGGTTRPSPVETVRVKRLVPGGYDPDAGSEYINENLQAPTGIPDVIDDSVQIVSVTILVYDNMALGDRITLDWGGHRLSHTLESTGEVNSPVLILVGRDVLEASPGRVIVRYEVRDVVNNWSKWSLSKETDAEVGNDFLLAPWVVEAPNDVLDLAALGGRDATAQAVDTQFKLSDTVRMHWLGVTAQGTQLDDLVIDKTVITPGRPLDFPIPNAKVQLIAQGHAVLRYELLPAVGGASKASRRTTVNVIGQVQRLTVPKVLEEVDGVLDPSRLSAAGATVHIDASDLIAPGDTVTLRWDGLTQGATPILYTLPILVTGDGQPIERPVPMQYITPLINGRVEVSYEVSKVDGGTLLSDVLHLLVRTATVGPVFGDESFEPQAPRPLPLNIPIPFANGLMITVTATALGTAISVPGINEFGERALYCAGGNKIKFAFGGEIRNFWFSHALTSTSNNSVQFFNASGGSVLVSNLKLPSDGIVAYEDFTLPSACVECELTVDTIGTMIDNLIWEG